MNLTNDQLLSQYDRIINGDGREWNGIEASYGLPSMCLFAIASRETNMQNIEGDWGRRPNDSAPRYHGYGYFQRDSQHGVDASYLNNVHRQAIDAASLMRDLINRYGDIRAAFAAYNSGQPNDQYTTGHDYGIDTLQRMLVLQRFRSAHPAQSRVGILQQALKTSADGVWGPATDMGAMGMRNAASLTTAHRKIGDFNVQAVQHILGVAETPLWTKEDQDKIGDWVGIVQGAVLQVQPDKIWGPVTDAAFMALRADNLRK